MSVGERDIDHLAALAKLRLDDEERERLAADLERIVAFVEELGRVDVAGVAPTKHVLALDGVARPDVESDCLTVEEALANAPSADEGHFVVPKVLPE